MRPLLGREVELGAVNRLLDVAGHGESAAVVLSGEPGIGKTALLAEALRMGHKRGYCILSGRAVEIERDLPFALFADALEEELGSLRHNHEDAFGEADWALLSSVFGSLYGSSATSTGALEFEPDERHRLLSAIHKLLALLSRERPLVLALDDLHWADPASIDLLCRLLHRGVGGSSLLLLALAARPDRAAIAESLRGGRASRPGPANRTGAPIDRRGRAALRHRDRAAVARGDLPRKRWQPVLSRAAARDGPVAASRRPGSRPALARWEFRWP